MEISETAQIVTDKLKKDYRIKGSGGMLLLETIAKSLSEIEAAEKQMEADSGQKGLNVIHYGFTLDRFGTVVKHPGNDTVKVATNKILACMKQLGIEIEKGNSKEIKSPLEKLMSKSA